MQTDLVQIYGLFHPDTNELRYIGKANCAKRRLASHMRDALRRKTPLYCWIKSLAESGKKPICKVLISVEHDCWKDAEKTAILMAKDQGFNLLNLAEGGDEPYCSTEVRRQNGRKTVASRNHKKMMTMIFLSNALRHGRVSEKTKQKMREIPEIFAKFSRYL